MAWTTCRDTHVRSLTQAVPSASRSPGTSPPEFQASPPRRSYSQGATAVLQCTLFVSSRNPSEQGRGLVFYTDPIAQSPADFRSYTSSYSTIAPQLIPDYAESPVDSMRGATLCTAADCAVLQPGNADAEAPGRARWALRSHNDTMAFSLSKTPLPMILGPSWNSEL